MIDYMLFWLAKELVMIGLFLVGMAVLVGACWFIGLFRGGK